jgi:uncharacterized protein
MISTMKIPKLGVGINYQPGFIPLLDSSEHLVDFIEISPDLLCKEFQGHSGQLEFSSERLQLALQYADKFPVVVHGLGLSIGSASGWNEDYLVVLDQFRAFQHFHWHSEHLGFLQFQQSNGEMSHAGVQLPLPFTSEALALLVPRINHLSERYDVPFLIENTTYNLPDMPDDAGMDEIAFLNALTEFTPCGLLLDLYNYYCNAINFGFDPYAGLSRLNMDAVIEIHIAGGVGYSSGGLQQNGMKSGAQKFLLDVHSDVVADPVWDLLDWTLARASNVSAVVYELLEQAHNIVGNELIREQLAKAKQLWKKHHIRLAAGSHGKVFRVSV